MTTVNYQEFYKAALEAAGGPASVVLPNNTYKVRVAKVKPGNSGSGKKFQVGIRFVVLEGEYESQSTWINQTLTTENPVAFGVFLKYMLALGVPQSVLDAGTPPEELSNYIVEGTIGFAELKGDRYWPKPPDPAAQLRQDLKSFKLIEVPTISTSGVAIPSGPTPAQPVPVAVAAPVAVAVPVAVPQPAAVPVPVPQPAPITIPTPTVDQATAAMAASADSPEVAALKAQLLALQGAPPAAPAAPAPVRPF